jgi:hypothetical protein
MDILRRIVQNIKRSLYFYNSHYEVRDYINDASQCLIRLQIQRSRVRIPALPQFLSSIGCVERSPLSLVSTTEELLARNSSGSGQENREYGRGDSLCRPRDALYPQKLPLTSPTYCCHSVGIVLSRTRPRILVFQFILGLWSCFVWAFGPLFCTHGFNFLPSAKTCLTRKLVK